MLFYTNNWAKSRYKFIKPGLYNIGQGIAWDIIEMVTNKPFRLNSKRIY